MPPTGHPGVFHYLIHCDDPEHAQQGLPAARPYAQAAVGAVDQDVHHRSLRILS
jgi:hypothetical protein